MPSTVFLKIEGIDGESEFSHEDSFDFTEVDDLMLTKADEGDDLLLVNNGDGSDLEGDGVVDGEDFNIWQTGYGGGHEDEIDIYSIYWGTTRTAGAEHEVEYDILMSF